MTDDQGFLEGLEPPSPPRGPREPVYTASERVYSGDQKDGPRYTAHRAVRDRKCDWCVIEMREHKRTRPPAQATTIREGDGIVLLLCYEHTQEAKVADAAAAKQTKDQGGT